jgi:hypothetical protein
MGWPEDMDVEREADDLLEDVSGRASNVIYVIDSDTPGALSTRREYLKAIGLANQTFVAWGLLDRVEPGRCGFNGWEFRLVGADYIPGFDDELGDNHQLMVIGRDRQKILTVAREQVDPQWEGYVNSGTKAWGGTESSSAGIGHLPAQLHDGENGRLTVAEGPLKNMGAAYHTHRGRVRSLLKGQIVYDEGFKGAAPGGKDYALLHLEPIHFHYHVALGLLHELGHTLIHSSLNTASDNHDEAYGIVMSWPYRSRPELKGASDPVAIYEHFTAPERNQHYIADAKAWRYTPSHPTLHLAELKCIQADDLGGDEAYLVVGGRKVWGPVSIDDGDTRPVGVDVEFLSAALQVHAYDEEGRFFEDDLVGSALIGRADRFEGPKRIELAGGSARYELRYEVR